jgi:hypothetical protein
VAVLADDFEILLRIDVQVVREMHELSEHVYLNPFNCSSFVEVGPDRIDLRNATAHDQVAVHARCESRNTRLGTYLDIHVTVLAVDLILSGVHIVAEEYRLARAFESCRVGDFRSFKHSIS